MSDWDFSFWAFKYRANKIENFLVAKLNPSVSRIKVIRTFLGWYSRTTVGIFVKMSIQKITYLVRQSVCNALSIHLFCWYQKLISRRGVYVWTCWGSNHFILNWLEFSWKPILSVSKDCQKHHQRNLTFFLSCFKISFNFGFEILVLPHFHQIHVFVLGALEWFVV